MMTIARELMTENPVCLRASERVSRAVEVLQTLEVRHVPIVNEDSELIGILSDRDLRALALPQLVNGEWVETIQTALQARISTFMTSEPLSVEVEADMAEIVDLMLDHKIGAVPVVDAENRLVGIVSYVDILRKMPIG